MAILLISCAPGSNRPAAQAHGAEAPERSTAASPRMSSVFPEAALDLLAQSARDSCSICAERNRKEAFEQLDAVYTPGVLITSDAARTFVASNGSPSELALSSYDREVPKLTLRFHTKTDHLVGVDSTDYSDESWAAFVSDNPRAVLEGTIQLIAYPYGDGPTYLYSQIENHLQLQCKVLELSAR